MFTSTRNTRQPPCRRHQVVHGLLLVSLLCLPLACQQSPKDETFVRALFPEQAPKAKSSIVYRAAPAVRVAVRAAAAPKIDGELNDACWRQAAALALANGSGTRAPTAIPPMALVCAGADAFYVAVVSPLTKGTQILSTARRRDRNVWQDESVEIFVDPGRTRKHYFQFLLNTLNTQQDSEGWNGDWNGKWQSALVVRDGETPGALPTALQQRHDLGATAKATHFWTCEVAIPYTTLRVQPPKQGDAWGLNVCRNDKRQREERIWAKVRVNNHEPTSFGELRFVTSPATTQFASLWYATTPREGANQLQVYVLDSAVPAARLTATLAMPNGGTLSVPTNDALPDGRYVLNVPLMRPGEHRLDLSLSSSKTGKAQDAAQYVFRLEPPPTLLGLKLDQKEYYASERVARAFVYTQAAAPKGQRVVRIALQSAAGRTLRQGTAPLPCSAAEIELDISDLPVGSYGLTVHLAGHNTTRRLTIISSPFDGR